MSKGIAEINVSDSDALRLKKINENFKQLVSGETPVGAVSGSGGGYNAMISRVGGSLSGSDRFVRNVSAYAIDAKYITAETIDTTALTTQYAYINLGNVENLTAEQFYARTGLIANLTTENVWTTSTLAAVKIQAASIEAEMITADKIKFKDGTEWSTASEFMLKNKGLMAALNAQALGGAKVLEAKLQDIEDNHPELFDMVCQMYDKQLDGSIIMAETIVAEKMKVADLEAFHATIGGFTINGDDGGLVGNLGGGGIIEFRPDGYFRVGNATSYVEVDPGEGSNTGRVDIVCDTTNVKEDLTIANTWKWDLTSSGSLNLLYIGQ